jgi:hypothetical protein
MIEYNKRFKRITNENINDLSDLISISGSSLNTFRYFENRDINVIKNHILTVILTVDEIDVAYGHIDMEFDRYWLGIMVIEQQISRGYGNIMMSYLIENCLLNRLDSIYLSVDINNSGAISLYKKYDFVEHGIINNNKLIMLRVFTT